MHVRNMQDLMNMHADTQYFTGKIDVSNLRPSQWVMNLPFKALTQPQQSVLAKVYAVISMNILHDQQVHTRQSNTYFIKIHVEYVRTVDINLHNTTMETKSNYI